MGSSLAFSLKEDPVRCAKVCDKSWVILRDSVKELKADSFIYATRKLSCTMKTLKSISCDRSDTRIFKCVCKKLWIMNKQKTSHSTTNKKPILCSTNLVHHKFKLQTKLKVKSIKLRYWLGICFFNNFCKKEIIFQCLFWNWIVNNTKDSGFFGHELN